MVYSWTEDLATGVAQVDAQHKELFVRVNNLLDACGKSKGKDEIAQFIGFLEAYVIEHFTAEERTMAAAGYPGLPGQQTEHREFIGKIADIKKEFVEYGTGVNVVLMAARASGEWLVNHIKKTDKAMAVYLREKGVR